MTLRNLIAAASLTLAVTVGASAADAALVTFDFQNGGPGANGTFGSITTAQGGISVTVTGGIYNGITDTIIDIDARTVTRTNSGLGVDCVVFPALCDNQIGLGFGIPDLLTLTFDQVVDFSSVLFTLVDGDDDFDLWVDGDLIVSDFTILGNNPYALTGLTGTTISFGADALNDNFRLGSITVAAIPLPAGGLLLLGGLAGLAALRRRRNLA